MYSLNSKNLFRYVANLTFLFCTLLKLNADTTSEYDYGFVAYLYSKHNTTFRCTGAIVAAYWILNYCEYGDYVYNAVHVGILLKKYRRDEYMQSYDISYRITYPGHEIQPFPQVDEIYDLRYLYASKHAVFLDRTETEIEMVSGRVRPIAVSRKVVLPTEAKTVFFPKADSSTTEAHHKMLPIVHYSVCDTYFKKYGLSINHTVQFCVNSSIVTYTECCASHAIMERNNVLIGVVAWSTACFTPPEPWVFTNIGVYYEWIVNTTSDDPIIFDKRAPGNKFSKSNLMFS